MIKKTFNLLILRESRILLSILVFSLGFLWPLLLSTKIDHFILRWALAICAELLFFFILAYYCYGRLTVNIDNEYISFSWQKKLFFNYKQIQSIRMAEITKITVDEAIILRKIISSNGSISINNTRSGIWFKSDSEKLIEYLKNQIPGLKVNDSWDDFAEKGFLNIALKINTVILIISLILMTIFITVKGFHSRYLLFLLSIIPQLTLYQIQMGKKSNNYDK